MTDLLLLGLDAERTHELASMFETAGYEVNQVRDIAACCRQLLAEMRSPHFIPIPITDPGACAAPSREITIFNADAIAASADARRRQPQLLACILSLARQLTPGWRLSMRHRRLEPPEGGPGIELTSLEFNFVKIFAMVDVGEAVSRKQIVKAFGEDYLSYDQNRIDTMVRRLRQKTESRMGLKLPLNTERVRGFSFGAVLIIDP